MDDSSKIVMFTLRRLQGILRAKDIKHACVNINEHGGKKILVEKIKYLINLIICLVFCDLGRYTQDKYEIC